MNFCTILSFNSQRGIPKAILGYASSDKHGGTINSSDWSFLVMLSSKRLMELPIKLIGNLALEYLFLIMFCQSWGYSFSSK